MIHQKLEPQHPIPHDSSLHKAIGAKHGSIVRAVGHGDQQGTVNDIE